MPVKDSVLVLAARSYACALNSKVAKPGTKYALMKMCALIRKACLTTWVYGTDITFECIHCTYHSTLLHVHLHNTSNDKGVNWLISAFPSCFEFCFGKILLMVLYRHYATSTHRYVCWIATGYSSSSFKRAHSRNSTSCIILFTKLTHKHYSTTVIEGLRARVVQPSYIT